MLLVLLAALFTQDATFVEHKLATVPWDVVLRNSETIFRPDGTVVLWAGKSERTGFATIYLNSQGGEPFDNVQHPLLAPDGKSFVFVASLGRQTFVVNGTHRDPAYEGVSQPYLSPDGRTLAYRAQTEQGQVMVVGGQPGKAYDLVRTPQFNPKTGEVVYTATLGKQGVMVVGTREVGLHDSAWYPCFSPDGERLAYGARDGKDAFVIVQGVRSKPYDDVSPPRFAADGTTVTFSANRNGHSFIVVGDREESASEQAFAYLLDPANQIRGYAFGKKGEQFLLWKGHPGPRFDAVYAFSVDAQGRTTFEPAASADRSQGAWRAQRGSKQLVIASGQEGPLFDTIGLPAYSPDGRTLAYVAVEREDYYEVVNDRRLGPFLFAGPPVFSPDSRKMAFGARIGDSFWWKVIDLDGGR